VARPPIHISGYATEPTYILLRKSDLVWLYCVRPQCLRCLATTSASLRCRRSTTTGTVSPRFVELFHRPTALASKKGKGSQYSNAERRVPELIPVLGSQPAGDPSHTTVGCHCFPPGLQLPSQP